MTWHTLKNEYGQWPEGTLQRKTLSQSARRQQSGSWVFTIYFNLLNRRSFLRTVFSVNVIDKPIWISSLRDGADRLPGSPSQATADSNLVPLSFLFPLLPSFSSWQGSTVAQAGFDLLILLHLLSKYWGYTYIYIYIISQHVSFFVPSLQAADYEFGGPISSTF